MPCTDGGPLKITETTSWTEQGEIKRLKDRNDQLAKLLCGLCRRIEQADSLELIGADTSLMKWWFEHREFDKREGR